VPKQADYKVPSVAPKAESIETFRKKDVASVVSTVQRAPARSSEPDLVKETPEGADVRERLSETGMRVRPGDGDRALEVGRKVMTSAGLPLTLTVSLLLRCLFDLARKKPIGHAGFLFATREQEVGRTVLETEFRDWLRTEGRAVQAALDALRNQQAELVEASAAADDTYPSLAPAQCGTDRQHDGAGGQLGGPDAVVGR
jgi:hypothetical protein